MGQGKDDEAVAALFPGDIPGRYKKIAAF